MQIRLILLVTQKKRKKKPLSLLCLEFKKIFFWEWGHRQLGRLIGLTYGLPWLYFAMRGKLKGKLLFQTGGVLMLGGMQGKSSMCSLSPR
jgi:heme A synthase